MSELFCLLFIAFLSDSLSLECYTEKYIQASGTENLGINQPRGMCTTTSWCTRVKFEGAYTKGTTKVKGQGHALGCAAKNFGDKCNDLVLVDGGCERQDRVELGKGDVVEGSVQLCCCNDEDFCFKSASHQIYSCVTAFLAVLIACIS